MRIILPGRERSDGINKLDEGHKGNKTTHGKQRTQRHLWCCNIVFDLEKV